MMPRLTGPHGRNSLRLRLDKAGRVDLPLIFPPPALCTGARTVVFLIGGEQTLSSLIEPADNAAMIAYVGLLRLQRGLIDPLTVMQRSKWPIDECEADFADETETTEKEQHLASAS